MIIENIGILFKLFQTDKNIASIEGLQHEMMIRSTWWSYHLSQYSQEYIVDFFFQVLNIHAEFSS